MARVPSGKFLRQVDDYLLQEVIGRGGMAVVFKAWDTRHNRWVALKIMQIEKFSPEEADILRKRFVREIRILMRLKHPSIVPILGYGEYQKRPYLVMPFYGHGSLQSHLRRRPVPWRRAIGFLLPLLDALEYAHARGIVHRDVKPSNILIDNNRKPVLGDFGVVSMVGKTTESLTRTGVGIGTPEYMAPEQALGKKVDQRADIYALGCVLYAMVAGAPPYEADTPIAVVMQHVQAEVPRLTSRVSGVPRQLDKIIKKALAKQPEKRYASVRALREDLEALLLQTAKGRGMAPAWRHQGMKLLLIVGLLLLVAVVPAMAFSQGWLGGGFGRKTPTPSITPYVLVPSVTPVAVLVGEQTKTLTPTLLPSPTSTNTSTPTWTPSPTRRWVPPTATRRPPTRRPPTRTPTPRPTKTPRPPSTPTNTPSAPPTPTNAPPPTPTPTNTSPPPTTPTPTNTSPPPTTPTPTDTPIPGGGGGS